MPRSDFGNAIQFFDKIGIFEVLLPFLLVFTLVYALLEKTRIFGTETIAGVTYTRKNLNSLTAFSIAFFVVASSRLVEIVTKVSSNMVILLMASVFFLLLVGSFHKETPEGFFLEKGLIRNSFIFIMFIGLAVIFLDAIKTGEKTWLQQVFDWIKDFGTNESVASIVLVLILIGALWFITAEQHKPESQANK